MTTAQVISPYTGHCLTASSTTSNATFSFAPCTGASSLTQLFALSQYVYYSLGYAAITSFGEVDFDLLEENLDEGQAQAWYLGSDNRTIKAIDYIYTQAGVSAKLL